MMLRLRSFISVLLIMMISSVIFSVTSLAENTNSNSPFRVISSKKEIIHEENGNIVTLTTTYLEGNLEEYINHLQKNGLAVKRLSEFETDSIEIDSSHDFQGATTVTRHNGDLFAYISASGNVNLGLTTATLDLDYSVASLTNRSGVTGFTDKQAQVEVDWTLYGAVGGKTIVVYEYNAKSDWANGLISFSDTHQKAGVVVFSFLNVYGNYKYKYHGYSYQFSVRCDINEI